MLYFTMNTFPTEEKQWKYEMRNPQITVAWIPVKAPPQVYVIRDCIFFPPCSVSAQDIIKNWDKC